ncbi:MAG: hypothetical protein ACI399_01305 [Candidatus Cryptobacteroides sp.]
MMKTGRTIVLAFALLCLCNLMPAQTSVTMQKKGDKYSGAAVTGGREKVMSGVRSDLRDNVRYNGTFKDETLDDFAKAMKEREWNSEDTAWKRACLLNTKEAYQKYISLYPRGPHRAEADKKLVEAKIDDIFKNNHGTLPAFAHVQEDGRPTSSLVMENTTEYPLTVMFSGPEIRSVVIDPGSILTITIKNGVYRVAASVPPGSIIPYAGTQTFTGGRYETGYCIVNAR